MLMRMLPEADLAQIPAGARGGAIDQAVNYLGQVTGSSRDGGVLYAWLRLLASNRKVSLSLPRFQPEKRGTIGSELEAFKDRVRAGPSSNRDCGLMRSAHTFCRS